MTGVQTCALPISKILEKPVVFKDFVVKSAIFYVEKPKSFPRRCPKDIRFRNVSASWNGKSEASATVAHITFLATKSGKLSDMLTVNSALTMAEGYDAAGNAMNVSLKFNTGKVAGGEFALYANTPNPFATSTTIGFNLPNDGQAKLTIYTAGGKVVSVINGTYKAGVNQVTVNKADLNASGMLYYRLDTQDNSSTRKMIIIE